MRPRAIEFGILAAMSLAVVPGMVKAQPIAASNMEINAFIKADTNQDGLLTRREFKVFVQQMAQAGQSTAKTIRLFGAYGFAFKTVDKNRDGFASPLEMRSADTKFQAGE